MTLLQKESDQKGDYNMPITSNTINNDPNRSGNMGDGCAPHISHRQFHHHIARRRDIKRRCKRCPWQRNYHISRRRHFLYRPFVGGFHVFDRAKGCLSYHQSRQWNDLHESHVLHLPSGHGRYDRTGTRRSRAAEKSAQS